MKTTVTRPAITCDGCDHLVGMTAEERAENRLTEKDLVCELTIPWDTDAAKSRDFVYLTFHFHAPNLHRHDCFRYWAHSPHIMRRSLEAREMDAAEIDEFMSTFLYREGPYNPGLERPKVEAKV